MPNITILKTPPSVVAAALTLTGMVLRLIGLGSRPLWFDEVISAVYARQDVATLLKLNAGDNHPPGYYLALKYWIDLFGPADAVVRLLSVLPGTASIWLVWLIGHRLFEANPRIGLAATALTAFSPFQIYFSQEARNYAVMELAVLAAGWCWWRGLATNRWVYWLGMYLAGTLGLLCNFTTAFYLLALGLYPFGRWRRYWASSVLARLVLTGGLTGLSAGVLLLPKLTGRLDTIKNNFWIPAPDILVVLRTFYTFVFGAIQPDRFVVAFGLAMVIVGITGWQVSSALTGKPPEGLVVSCWLLVAPVGLVIIVSWTFQPLYLDKALIGCAPFYYLLLGWAIFRSDRTRAGGWILAGVPTGLALALALLVLPDLYSGTVNPLFIARYDAVGLNRYLNEQAQPGDLVVTATDISWLPLVYYNQGLPPAKYPLKDYPYPNIFPALVETLQSRWPSRAEVAQPKRRTWVVYEVNAPPDTLRLPPRPASLESEPAWLHSPDWQRETLQWFEQRYNRQKAVWLERILLVLYTE